MRFFIHTQSFIHPFPAPVLSLTRFLVSKKRYVRSEQGFSIGGTDNMIDKTNQEGDIRWLTKFRIERLGEGKSDNFFLDEPF